MKKFLVIALASVLSLTAMVSVSAAPVVIYFDTLADGSVDFNGTESDLSFNIISGGTMINDKVTVGAEFGTGDNEGDDVSLWSAKGGYRFYDARATKLNGVVALLNLGTEGGDLSSTLIGLDFTQFFSEKLFVSGTIGYSVDGSFEDFDASVTLIRAKLYYLINDNWGAALGYTDLSYDF
ncbi:MAG: hypothetical protein ACM3YE_00080, partial [Bacteroidota bacterium]